ncbi:MAG: hypothetical protein MUC28_01950 [Planctomycetes bacterium]|jgi:hypothetical protein|nr:hypothetical protein [Planctomycetota bacterium]
MEIKRGKKRFVVIVGNCVFKYPTLLSPKYIKHWTRRPIQTFKDLLLEIGHNWSEFTFCLKNKTPFLLRTYFSFFGIFNIQIQKFGESIEMREGAMFVQFNLLTNQDVWHLADEHTFANKENFCKSDGHIRIRDYGGKNTQAIIQKYGNKIYENFRFDFKT